MTYSVTAMALTNQSGQSGSGANAYRWNGTGFDAAVASTGNISALTPYGGYSASFTLANLGLYAIFWGSSNFSQGWINVTAAGTYLCGGDPYSSQLLFDSNSNVYANASTIAESILATPSNKLATNSDGSVNVDFQGAGSVTVTITVNDGATPTPNPIQSAIVNLLVNNSHYYATTNSSGVAVLTPTEGNAIYEVEVTANGYQFTPKTLTVSGATSHTYSMTAITITPSTGGGVTMYSYTTDTTGETIEGNVVVYYRMIGTASGDTGFIANPNALTVTSNSSGLAQFVNLRPSTVYEYCTHRAINPQWVQFTSAASGSAAIAGNIT